MKHLSLKGSPQERGHIHGESLRADIQSFAALRKELLLKVLPQEKLNTLVEAHLNFFKNDLELWAEFEALAQAAGLELCDLMILNNHTDLRDFSLVSDDYLASFFECSCFALQKKSGLIVIGQTWDMHASAEPYVCHLTLEKELNGQTVKQEIFSLAGCLALTGTSSTGVGVYINNLRSSELKIGLPWPAVVRKLLDCASLADVKPTLQKNSGSAGRNFLVATAREARNFEVTGQNVSSAGSTQDNSENILLHTNHYLSGLKATEDLANRSKSTLDRYDYVQKKLRTLAHPEGDAHDLAQKLLTSADADKVFCIPAPSDDPHGSATCGGHLFDYQSGKGFSFTGLYSSRDFFEFQL